MSLTHGASIARNGLVLFVDAANPKSYPGSGTTWFDLSGQGNDVTLYGSPTYSSNTFTFNGSSQYARTTNTLNLTSTSAVTIIHFIKVLTYTSTSILHELSTDFNSYSDCFVASYADNSGSTPNTPCIASSRGNVGYNISVNDKTLLNGSTWKAHCVVHDTSQPSKENMIYSNGTTTNETTNPLTGYGNNNTNMFSNRHLYLYSRAGSAYFCNIQVSAVAVYNRVLAASEIQRNFEAMRGRYGV